MFSPSTSTASKRIRENIFIFHSSDERHIAQLHTPLQHNARKQEGFKKVHLNDNSTNQAIYQEKKNV